MYYSAWERMGREKRDLLEKKVVQVRESQTEGAQQLQDALTRLKALTGYQGGELEKFYRNLQSDYNDASSKAEEIRTRIRQMDQIAKDLFKEWEQESAEIATPDLREGSLSQLRDTRNRYDSLYAATTKAEKSMAPVLGKFHDYVLFLKHNLNAQAIGALQGETANIQAAIAKLIADMNASIKEADAFIKASK